MMYLKHNKMFQSVKPRIQFIQRFGVDLNLIEISEEQIPSDRVLEYWEIKKMITPTNFCKPNYESSSSK